MMCWVHGHGRAPNTQAQLFRPEREEDEERPLERLDEPELPLERAPEELEDDPLERLTPESRDGGLEERPTPLELVEPLVRGRTPEEEDRVLELRPTADPVRLVVRLGTARLPVDPLVRVVAREPVDDEGRVPTVERVVRVAERVSPIRDVLLGVERVVVAARVLPTVVRVVRSPDNIPREGRTPVASPLAAAVAPRPPVETTLRVFMSPRPVSEPRESVAMPVSRPPRVSRERLVSALRAIVAPRGL
jgi:hypothetical protein